MSTSRILSVSFAALAVLLLAAALLVPLIPHPGGERAGRTILRLTCHGRAERSLVVAGGPMAICARCTGIWAGVALGALLFATGLGRRPEIDGRVMFLIALPLVLDGVTQALGWRESTNVLRLATGFPTGLVGIVWALQYSLRTSERSEYEAATR